MTACLSLMTLLAVTATTPSPTCAGDGKPTTLTERHAEAIADACTAYITSFPDRNKALDAELAHLSETLAETLAADMAGRRAGEFERCAPLLLIEGTNHPLAHLGFAVAAHLLPVNPSPFGNAETAEEHFSAALSQLSEASHRAPMILLYEAADAAAQWAATGGTQE